MAFDPKHILVPVAIDAPEDMALAEHALFAACDIAIKFSSRITLLHLIPALQPGASINVDVLGQAYESYLKVLESRMREGRRKIKALQEAAKEQHGVSVEAKVSDSFEGVAKLILESAEEMGADLIVMGSHGRHGLSHALFGSVAEKIAQKASIPVLMLHPYVSKAAP